MIPLFSDQARAWIAQPDACLHKIVISFLGFPLWLSTLMAGSGLPIVLLKVAEDLASATHGIVPVFS
ncbi:MAG TPA: hypothetical protein VN924_06670 [Bryobacteraceae bacterium]|nr:hypothetical protein [Bryobacteraceae bacterium]